MPACRGHAPGALCDIDLLQIAFPGPDRQWTPAVRGVSLTLAPGERLGIVGESGSGKSLTGRALLGQLPPAARMSAQTLRYAGRDLLAMPAAERRRLCGQEMGMILQDPKYSLNPVMTVGRQMREAWALRNPGMKRREMDERVLASLDAVRIRDPRRVAASYAHELSGGMGQRVMIAMMAANGPRLLVADEPTSALDVLVAMQVLDVLDDMVARHGTGLIFISHDLPLVGAFCDRVAVMYAGRIVETCAASELRQAQHPYTRALLAASPTLMDQPERLPVIQRDPAWLQAEQASKP
ncbi:ABC transporter ATP-binding protein [Bordetella sp. FB-8]|uniref:ABC transporter ATP-binding protein n=1 Tax=Bordetella sp. FB-8 TaxID=1159870 RepID=UPI0004758CFD